MKLFHSRASRAFSAPFSDEFNAGLQAGLQQAYAVEGASPALRQRIADMAALHEQQTVMQKPHRSRRRFLFAFGGAIVFSLGFVVVASLFGRVYNVPSASMEPTLLGSETLEATRQGPDVIYYTSAAHDTVLVNKGSYRWGTPQFGDIVVFRAPKQADAEHRYSGFQREYQLTKRIIGLPGDTIEIKQGHVYRNGNPLNEFHNPDWPYSIKEPMDPELEPQSKFATALRGGALRLKAGEYWVLGDNRNDSNDSRYWGVLERNRIIGKVSFILAPLKRWRSLP